MSDQAWAAAIGALTIITLRVVDYFLPTGRISRWAARHSVDKDHPDEEDENVVEQ